MLDSPVVVLFTVLVSQVVSLYLVLFVSRFSVKEIFFAQSLQFVIHCMHITVLPVVFNKRCRLVKRPCVDECACVSGHVWQCV